jgi:Flavodoxin domain
MAMTVKVLVAYGTERGSTGEIADAIGLELREMGLDVDVMPAREVPNVEPYDAVVLGGALCAGRWHRDARSFAGRFFRELTERPVWLFSSGPIDSSASEGEIPPVTFVSGLMATIGARGHATLGGWLAPDTKGLIARAMAKKLDGDHRDFGQIRRWAHEVGSETFALS